MPSKPTNDGDVEGPAALIRSMPIADIVPADYNPRMQLQPGDAEYEALKHSIVQFGLVEPLVWNERTGTLVGGHQRLTVLRDLGWTEATVAVVDLDEEKERALNVALNKIEGQWDDTKLLEVIQQVQIDPDLFAVTGFTEAEVDDLMRRIDQASATDFLDDLISKADEELDFNAGTDDAYPDDAPPPAAKDDGQAWYTLSFTLSKEGRETVLEALRLARDAYDADTSNEALVAVMGRVRDELAAALERPTSEHTGEPADGDDAEVEA